MICFKDMTFCDSDCTNKDCARLWTEELQKQADEWWGGAGKGAPVAFSDFSGGCEEYAKED